MTTLTIRPTTTNTIGAIRCSNATYSVARAGTGTFTTISSGASIPGGQRLFSGTYDLNQGFFNFPVGSAVPGAVVISAIFEWTTGGANVTGGEVQNILDYASGAIANADWRDGTALAGLTSWGTVPKSGSYQTNSTTCQINLNATAIASIQTTLRAGGTVGFMMVDQNQIDDVAPAGNDRYDILSEEDATAANRPALIIEYHLVGEALLAGRKLSQMRLVG